jgi:hypothetical protein
MPPVHEDRREQAQQGQSQGQEEGGERMMRFSTIPRSNRPESVTAHSVQDWREFVDFLTDPDNNTFCSKPYDNTAEARKEQAPGFIGAFLDPDAGGACREAVKAVGFLHVDIDFYEEVAEFVPGADKSKPGRIVKTKRRVKTAITKIEQVRDVFQKAGVLAAVYETLSSTPDGIRARALVPLDREVTPDEAPKAFTELMAFLEPLAAAIDIGVGLRVGGHVYMPMGAPVLETVGCDPFAPELLGEVMAPREPVGIAEARKLLKKDRKKLGVASDFENGDLEDWYQRFMIDFRTLDLKAALEEVGCKVGRARNMGNGLVKYPCTCPLAEEHTQGKTHRDEAVIFLNGDGVWPSFQCQHSHKVTLKELVLGTADGTDPVFTQEILSKHAAAWTPTMPQVAVERAQKIRAIQQESTNGLGPWFPHTMIRREDTLPDSVARTNPKTGAVIINFPATAANLWYIVQHDERFKDLWFCEMRGITFLDGKPFTDEMIGRVLIQLSADYQFSTKPDDTKLYRTICTASLLNKRYLPTEYLEALPIPQRNDAEFERVVVEHLGVDPSAAQDAALYFKHFAVGTVARALTPRSEFDDTAKMDDMMIWQGGQGSGKSTFVRSLVPQPWMSGELNPPATGRYDSVAFIAMIQRGWINEMGEVERAFKRFDELKAFLSTRSDIVQLKYLNGSVAFPRRCSFIGTSNGDALLEDPTGNRRMFIIRCAVKPGFTIKPLSPLQRDALWSAAVAAWKAGDNWWLTKDEEKRKDLTDATSNHKLGGNTLVHWIAKQLLKQAADWTAPFTYMDLLEQIKGRFAGDPEVNITDSSVGNALKFLGVTSKRVVKWVNGKTVSGPMLKQVSFKTWEIARGLGIVGEDEGPATQSDFDAIVEKKS